LSDIKGQQHTIPIDTTGHLNPSHLFDQPDCATDKWMCGHCEQTIMLEGTKSHLCSEPNGACSREEIGEGKRVSQSTV